MKGEYNILALLGGNMAVKVKLNKLSDSAVTPTKAHSTDSGYDLTFTSIKKIVGDVIFFGTGISVQPSGGYYFDIVPRSSISKLPFSMANSVGIIDNHYTGELIIPVRVHHSNQGGDTKTTSYPNGIVKIDSSRPPTILALAEWVLARKPKMFQMILRKKYNCEFTEETLEETERSNGGFGSTDS